MPIKTLLFDLDGTLVNSKKGIINSVCFALNKMGYPIPDENILERFIGPPLNDSFSKYCGMDQKQSIEAIKCYREYYSVSGLFECELYPEVLDTLSDLKCKGYSLFIATSKPEVYTKRIADRLGILSFFDGIVGSELSGERVRKKDVISHLLDSYSLDKTEVVMIGDTPFDILPTHDIGIYSIAVSYGFGLKDELNASNPSSIVSSFSQIPKAIQDLGGV